MDKWILSKGERVGLFSVRTIKSVRTVEDYEDHTIIFESLYGGESYAFDYETSQEMNEAFNRLIDFLGSNPRTLTSLIHEL